MKKCDLNTPPFTLLNRGKVLKLSLFASQISKIPLWVDKGRLLHLLPFLEYQLFLPERFPDVESISIFVDNWLKVFSVKKCSLKSSEWMLLWEYKIELSTNCHLVYLPIDSERWMEHWTHVINAGDLYKIAGKLILYINDLRVRERK